MSRVPRGVRAVFFDAVGTLIHPEPSAGAIYASVGRRFGSRLDPAEVRRRFALVFDEEEHADAADGFRTDEAREVRRWRAIVARVLDDVEDRQGCFEALYEHFARPAAWRVEPGAGEVIRRLREGGLAVGIASNFDARLRGVLNGLDGVSIGGPVLISSEVGWKKPAREFFKLLCHSVSSDPQEVLFVGDDLDNDYAGARAAGLHALLFDPLRRSPEALAALAELLPS
jgi:putative hydrolase of the HAD superfamily